MIENTKKTVLNFSIPKINIISLYTYTVFCFCLS